MSYVSTVVAGDVPRLPVDQIYRYMGGKPTAEDLAVRELVETLLPQFMDSLQCRACWMQVPVRIVGDSVDFDVFVVESSHLAKNLRGCNFAVLIAATLGMETELRRKRAAVTSPAKTLVLDAMGNAAIEAFCDSLCEQFSNRFPTHKIRPRFSPGYGDFSLEIQKVLLEVLNAGRKIGVQLTDGMLMIPQKSVTAVVGFGSAGCPMNQGTCDACIKTDCEFRL